MKLIKNKWSKCKHTYWKKDYHIGKLQDSVMCCLEESHFKYKGMERLKLKEWEKMYNEKTKKKKKKAGILTFNEVDFRTRYITFDKKRTLPNDK